jgi:hypothetical protein
MSREATSRMGRVERAIAAALRDPVGVARLAGGDLDFTIRSMRRARLLGRFAWQLRESDTLKQLPRTAIDALNGSLALAEARARLARWELNRIGWALSDLPDVPLIAMKGCAYLLAGTSNAGGRLFADVDLLLPEDDLPAVESRLAGRGWRMKELTAYDDDYYRLWTHELPPMMHVEREVEVDLHHNLVMRTARLRPDGSKLVRDAVAVEGSRFKVLAPVDMVLHAVTHLFFSSEMDDGLRELVDIDDLLRDFAERETGFWERFWPRAEELDLARSAFYGLRYANRLLGTPVPEEVLRASRSGAPPAPVLAIMDRLVPRALYPQHPDHHSRRTAMARLLLYMRSHWIRMPPLMLARHLSYKFYLRHVRRVPRPGEPAAPTMQH